MKYKIFQGQNDTDLEKAMNAWLENNKGIKIVRSDISIPTITVPRIEDNKPTTRKQPHWVASVFYEPDNH